MPGTRLEPEAALAARYGAAVAEALAAFARTGLLDRQPYGAVITGRPVQWRIECSGVRFPAVIEQFEMRMLVAPACAELARINAADPDIAELHHLSERISARAAAGEPTFEDEREFNLALAEISGNPFLIAPTRQLWHLADSHSWRLIRERSDGQAEWVETASDYEAIAAAVVHGDASAAGAAMRRHLRHLDRRYFRGGGVDGSAAT